jgi:hypothetical protein
MMRLRKPTIRYYLENTFYPSARYQYRQPGLDEHRNRCHELPDVLRSGQKNQADQS